MLLGFDRNASPLSHRSPRSKIDIGFRIVLEDVCDLLFNVTAPLLVELEGLQVLLDLGYLGETHQAGGHISIGEHPGESQLGLGVPKRGS